MIVWTTKRVVTVLVGMLTILGWGVPSWASSAQVDGSAPTTITTLRVLDWNLCGVNCAPRGGVTGRAYAVEHAVKAWSADVITLQEVCISQLKGMAAGLHWNASFKRESDQPACSGSDKRFGSGILSRSPQGMMSYYPLPPFEEGQNQWLSCVPVQGVTVCNTHIEAHVPDAKYQQIMEVMDVVRGLPGRVVVAGDFNKDYDSLTMQNHVYPYLTEVDEATNESTVGDQDTKIDYVFASGNPVVYGDSATYGPGSVSDHRLLRGTITWR